MNFPGPAAVNAVPVRHSAIGPLIVTARHVPSDAVVLGVCGEVDTSTSPFLQDTLLSYLNDSAARMVVDLTEVSFLSAAGLTVLVTVRQAAVAAGITFSLVAGPRAVLLPLRITGLDREFDIHPELVHGDG